MFKTAVVLVGGRGTRLGALTDHTPKPLIDVCGRPFLAHVFDYLTSQGVETCVLATGYLGQMFVEEFGDHYSGLALRYVQEKTPLGTGGAILGCAESLSGPFIVLNGDTLFPIDLRAMFAMHMAASAELTIGARWVAQVARYGALHVDGDRVVSISEKGADGAGVINGGVYALTREIFGARKPGDAFSFERDVMPEAVSRGHVHAFSGTSYFRDIGVQDDLELARRELGDFRHLLG